jgi:hypothetical protein
MKRPRSKSALALKLAEKAQTGRYGLLVWLRSNYADLAAARTELRVSFEHMAEAAAEAGIKDGQGNEPKHWTVRKFFKQVEMEQRTVLGDPAPKPAPGAGQGAPHTADAGLNSPATALRKGRLRGHVPRREGPVTVPVARSVPTPTPADEVIGQFAGERPPSRFSQRDDE